MVSASIVLLQPEAELSKKIRAELNEDERTRDQNLATLRSWLEKQPHLPKDMTDGCLLSFLRGCSFSLEKAKKKIDMYYTMRAACPEFFTNRDIDNPELTDLANRAQGTPMPGLTPKGYRVTVNRALDHDLDTHQIIDAFKAAMMIGDIRLHEETEGIAGDVEIVDASAATPSHLARVSPSAIKKFLICVQEAYPIKLKEVHIINASPFIDTVYSFVKPLLKEKIRKRIFFHKDYTSLHKYVPRELLPDEYGGTGPSLYDVNQAWREKLREYKDWFKEQEPLVANEALRPGKPTNYDELFGIDGSFKQLAID